MKKLLVMLIAFTGLFVACDKQDNLDTNNRQLDRATIDRIGQMHNEALKLVLENTIEIPPHKEMTNSIYQLTRATLPEEYALFQAQGFKPGNAFDEMLVNNKDLDYKKFISEIKSSAGLKSSLNELLDILEQNLPLSEMTDLVIRIEDRALETLSQEDAVVFLSAASVARHSAKFWYSEIRGGEGGIKYLKAPKTQSFDIIYDEYGNPIDTEDPEYQLRINPWKVVAADAIGVVATAAISVVNSGGASALPNPLFGGIPTAGIAGLIGGVAASATSVVGQW